ncbi:MAG: hypothetical protein ACLTYN_10355 [Dysosmobacter welbionis]
MGGGGLGGALAAGPAAYPATGATASQFSSWYAAGVAVGLYGVGQTAWYVQLGKLRDLPLLALFLAAAVWCTVRQFWRLGGEPDETRRRQERIIALLYTVAQESFSC